MRANVIVFEAAMLIFAPFFYYGSRKVLGRSRARVLAGGAIAFALVVETVAVLCGVMNFYWYATNGYYKHYPLGGYIIWLGLVPLAACLLFYMVTGASLLAATWLGRNWNRWARAALAGGLGVLFYLLIEPVAVTNHWWAWNVKSFYLIDVPVLAWIAVFVAVFVISAAFQLTELERADLKPLTWLEARTVRRWPLKTKEATANLTAHQLQGLFFFRLLVALAAFAVVITPVMTLLWLVANRGVVPPGW